jgi:hypothetical protein
MRTSLQVLLTVVVIAGCKPETARPVPVEQPPSGPTITSGPAPAQPPAVVQDAGEDDGAMTPGKAREEVPEQEAGSTGILKVLKDSVGKEKTPNVLTPGGDFNEEEMRAIDEALGTLENKPPPPMDTP